MGVHDLANSCSGLSVEELNEFGAGHGLGEDGPPKSGELASSGQALLSPYRAGIFDLDIRMVYAPLTRCRAIGENLVLKRFCILYTSLSLEVCLRSVSGLDPRTIAGT
jgi:hypothetical protein